MQTHPGERRPSGPRRRSAAAVVFAALVLVAGLGLARPAAALPTSTEQQFFDLLNQARLSAGRGALMWDENMLGDARSWASHMASTGTLSHDPNLASEIGAYYPDWTAIAENVGTGGSVTAINSAFIASAQHYANMLGDFNRVSIGVAMSGSTIWVVVRFARSNAPYTVQPPTSSSGPSSVVLGLDQDGRLEAFRYNGDGSLSTKWQTAVGCCWSGWAPMAGKLAAPPTVGRNADGRPVLFGVDGNGNLVRNTFRSTTGWSGWVAVTGGGRMRPESPAVASNADGRLQVFARRTDNTVGTSWQGKVSDDGSWSGTASMGGLWAGPTAAGVNADGRLELFGPNLRNELAHTWQLAPNSGWSGQLGEGQAMDVFAPPALALSPDLRQEVFFRDPAGNLMHAWQVRPNSAWSGFVGMGHLEPGRVTVVANSDGRLELFGRSGGTSVVHSWQVAPGSSWSAVVPMYSTSAGDPGLGRNEDGRLEIFVTGSSGGVSGAWQLAPSGAWSAWAPA